MKKRVIIVILMMLVLTQISYSLNNDSQNFCSQEDGVTKCLSENNIIGYTPIKYLDDIHCLSNQSIFNSKTVMVCYSTIKFTKPETFKINYIRGTTPQEKKNGDGYIIEETEAKKYFPNMKINALVNPDMINQNLCKKTYSDNQLKRYEFTCSYKNKEQDAKFLFLPQNTIFLLEEKKDFSSEFILNNLIYILLVLIIIAIVFSMKKKK